MTPLLQLTGITKRFPGVLALNDVDLAMAPGEIRALIGENGAGKSTLIKILAGIYQADKGEILLNGTAQQVASPIQAKELGFAFIHQDVNLVPYFNAIENIYLGHEYPRRGLWFARRAMKAKVKELADKFHFRLDLERPVMALSTADRWLVAILKAFMLDAKLLVLDEPTAALTSEEIQSLFTSLRLMQDQGVSIIYISHRLEEIFQIADTVTVLRNGEKVADLAVADTSKDQLISLMTGKKARQRFPEHRGVPAGQETVLRVQDLKGQGFSDVSFHLNKGEILGFFGLIGSGRTELMESLFGLRPLSQGTVELMGEEIRPTNPRQMIAKGMAFIPEDRRDAGLVLGMNVSENISLPNLDRWRKVAHRLDKRKIAAESRVLVDTLAIKTPSLKQYLRFLSGGNQQKVVIAKWIGRENSLIIFDEPTVGIDVGARSDIYELVHQLANDMGVIVVSSELPEIIGLCTRVIVMRQGRVAGELSQGEFSEEKILQLCYMDAPRAGEEKA